MCYDNTVFEPKKIRAKMEQVCITHGKEVGACVERMRCRFRDSIVEPVNEFIESVTEK